MLPYPLLNTGALTSGIVEIHHTYHSFGLSVKVWRIMPLSIRLYADNFNIQTLSFPWIVPHTKLPQLVLFSCLEFDCSAEEVVKTHTGKPPHSDRINTCLLSIYHHRCPFPSPYMGSSVVSFWPDTSSFWQCYWYQPILISYFKSVLI